MSRHWRHRRHDRIGDLILYREDVFDIVVE
jgi:hypothetical protein